ncbi:hypothetical protein UFOVP1616_2 [uncultured Caudovirales phage]|uniref:Uncharacterized protein n=1 Tax=uncultured Caudovirales phage TaxID=2100421 RepID=A0A6J5SJN4_9CAUD|nr:hypothetical protein UFOVP1467_18 [uncultured Caudovirales phage]CAB4219617.1 hypothetical protein UFOVP1616_2 [uncultured Caudovirales phage]
MSAEFTLAKALDELNKINDAFAKKKMERSKWHGELGKLATKMNAAGFGWDELAAEQERRLAARKASA